MRAPDDRIWFGPVRLEAWTNEKLDELNAEADWQEQLADERRDYSSYGLMSPKALLDAALTSAHGGNLAPLRRLFPELAKFLHEPPRKRGQHRRTQTAAPVVAKRWVTQSSLAQAVADRRRIPQLWREHFGKTYRGKEQPTAAEIAARRNGVTDQQLENYLKGRRRKR